MKKILIAAIALLSIGAKVSAQQAVCPKDVPMVKMGGKINSLTLGSGSATASAVVTRDNTMALNTWYSKIDTVTNTGVDSIAQTVKSSTKRIYTWAYVNGYSGTNTSCTLALQRSGDVTNANAWVSVYTVTVTAGVKGYSYEFDAFGGDGFRWYLTGVGTHASAWYVGMKAR